jgi:hypothetical protein
MNLFGIDLSGRDLWLLTIAGCGLAWLIHHWLAIARDRRAREMDARAVFRKAFMGVLSALRELQVNEPGQIYPILRGCYHEHEAAYFALRGDLGLFAKAALTRKWMAYRGPTPEAPELPEEDRRYRLSRFIGKDVDEEKIAQRRAIASIERLIA